MYAPDEAAAIAHAVAKIHSVSYERDLRSAVNVDISDNQIICHVSFKLTEVDQLLMRRGMHDTMKAARDAFEVALSPALTAAVERATGRTVLAHTSQTDLHARVTIESFSLRDATPATPGV